MISLKNHHRGFWLCLLVLPLLAGGCVRSIQPILKDDQAVLKPELVGKWQDDKNIMDVVSVEENAKTYKVIYTDGDGKTGKFLVRFGEIGKTLVAEVHPEDPTPDASDVYKAHLMPLYSFLIIKQTKPHPVVATVNTKWMTLYLREHPEALKVAEMHGDDECVLSCSTEELQAFITRHLDDKEFLNEPSDLVHPGDATTQPQGRTKPLTK